MMSETIKMIMVKRHLTGKDLAEALGCSSQNIYALLKKDRWTLSQLKSLEPVLGAKLYVGFQLNDTKETFGDLNLEK